MRVQFFFCLDAMISLAWERLWFAGWFMFCERYPVCDLYKELCGLEIFARAMGRFFGTLCPFLYSLCWASTLTS